MRAFLFAALLSLSACCPNGEHDRLVLSGPFPDDTGDVLRAASEACGRDIVGRVTWHPDLLDRDSYGYCVWGYGCPISAWVVPDPGTKGRASYSALAHEIGHWCLESGDENRIRRWACEVNIRSRCYSRGLPRDCGDAEIDNYCPYA